MHACGEGYYLGESSDRRQFDDNGVEIDLIMAETETLCICKLCHLPIF